MILNEDAIKRLFLESFDSIKIRSREGCPSFVALAHSYSPKASRRIKKKIADHVTRCPACFKEFTFLTLLHSKEIELAERAAEWAHSRDRSSTLKSGIPLFYEYASSGLVLLFIFASLFFMLSSLYSPSVRGEPMQYINAIFPENLFLADDPITFVWEKIDDSSIYSLELYDDALRLLWKAIDIPSPSIDLPSHILTALEDNTKYYWLVLGKSANQVSYHSYIKAFSVFHTAKRKPQMGVSRIPH